MSSPTVTINLVVLNGEKYIRHCLDAILAQTYPHELVELNILDNGSSDNTVSIIENSRFQILNSRFSKLNFIKNKINLGVWPGQEELLKYTNGKYVVCLCVDVLMDKDFIKNAVEIMEKDDKIGALQPKIYKFDISSLPAYQLTSLPAEVIDTCGFQIFKSRRIINIGHGLSFASPSHKATELQSKASESKEFDFDKEQEIFAVEGAVPVFRKSALKSCRIQIQDSRFKIPDSEIVDHDYFWYGDDLDLTWRMRLFGWKEILAPKVIAWHDRQTTKSVKKTWLDYFRRVPVRRQIPIKKRRLDWRNTRWTLIKNDYTINILKDLPWIISREIAVLGYAILFEPAVLKEIPTFFKYLPKMFRKRREIMKRAVVTPKEIRKWMK
ncbi:MAG: glycosyltransferase [Patescibacteria group bacterium]